MITRSRAVLPLAAAVLTLIPPAAHGQSALQEERIAASFVLALGRVPTPSEIGQWSKGDALSVAEMVARHRRQLGSDPAARRAVALRAQQDAFGRPPSETDLGSASGGVTYTELMLRHIRWLAEHPVEYEQVMNRAYQLLLRRDAYSVEIDYWRRQPTLSFALLVACIDNWAFRNRPGLMATTGTAAASVNSEYLDAARLSPAVAAEARAAAGLEPIDDPVLALAAGRTLVAPGANHVVSVGGIYFTAAGAPYR